MRKLNFAALVWTLTLLFMVVGISLLFLTGCLEYFLHPRSWGALAVSEFALILLMLASVRNWRSDHSRSIGVGHMLFLFPLLCALLVSPGMLPRQMIVQKGIDAVFHGHSHSHGEGRRVVLQPGERIVVTDDEFLTMIEQFWEQIDDLAGREVEINGFVYTDPTLARNDFVLARLVMTCCAADAEVAGLLCRWSGREGLQDGEWVRVVGTLGKLQYYNVHEQIVQIMPYIEVIILNRTDKPDQEYIYP